ncbi:MAG: hypothetical protein CMH46_00660 [Muricauda sp.]|nr:Snf7 family protein [Allomuricauda sp.]MAU14035.1 hypothetical protein [Allomuricauda sp.]
MFRRCYRRKNKQTQSIATYINDMKNLDHTLELMIGRVKQDIIRITRGQKPTKHLARRRLMYKRHIQNIEERRNHVLARTLQLENLHLNELQVRSLKNVADAHRSSSLNTEDVEELIDKLDQFKDDFDDINDMLTKDLDFDTADLSEEELLKELENCITENETFSVKKEEVPVELVFPEIPAVNKVDVWRRKFDEKVRTVV